MAHPEQHAFCEAVKRRFPEFFRNVRVLDIGSLDVNGNNRGLFSEADYVGIDLEPGPNVDVVCKAHEYQSRDAKKFDVVISTEALEHDMYYPLTMRNACRLLRDGGLLLFTCATTGRPEHGTHRNSPDDSPFTAKRAGWDNYYKNLTEDDLRELIDFEKTFKQYEFYVEHHTQDLQFWGVKGSP